jgi:hypothetical protein
VDAKKKIEIPGETVASYAKRTGQISLFSTRGAELKNSEGWKKVDLSYRLRAGDSVRPCAPKDSIDGVVSLLKMLRRKK